jgi:hypothetical protein
MMALRPRLDFGGVKIMPFRLEPADDLHRENLIGRMRFRKPPLLLRDAILDCEGALLALRKQTTSWSAIVYPAD